MNLNQLLYFCAVARTGSYSRAAEESDVSQPVVYRAVRSLEKACGVRLLERLGKRICLTGSGRAIYDYASQIASLANLAEQTLVQETELISGRMSVGAGTPVGSFLLPNILAKWMSEHPRVNISLVLGQMQEIEKLLLEDRLDLIFASGTKWAPGLRRELIFSDNLVVVSAPDHPFAKSPLLSVGELSKERMIASFRESYIRSEIEQVEYQYGVQFKVVMEVNRQDAAKQLCRAGVGVAVLPRSVVTEEVANNQLSLLNVEGFPRSRAYFLVYRVGKTLTPEMQSLISAVRLWVQERRNG